MRSKSRAVVAALAAVIAVNAAAPVAARSPKAQRTAVHEQRGGRRVPAPAPRPTVRRPARSSQVVFIGGYYYDPFFGPYPWWPRPAYPGWYFPYYDDRAEVRIACHERAAAVYVDGFYAGIVDDFDGVFQRLPLPPGPHRVSLYLEGYVTANFSVYLRRGSTFTIHHEMVRLAPGGVSRPPAIAPPVPPPPDGTYTPPRGTPPVTAPSAPSFSTAEVGTIEIRVQPASAAVMIDGERWMSSDEGRYEVQLPAGSHRIEVSAAGYRSFSSAVQVDEGEPAHVNVSLVRER
ncbi:MAG TPA: PEGA domain-containing protein [Vicinamibacterales bacterium]|nr:PEGA domain-containing protein [Vicinamibacterales bacterium]